MICFSNLLRPLASPGSNIHFSKRFLELEVKPIGDPCVFHCSMILPVLWAHNPVNFAEFDELILYEGCMTSEIENSSKHETGIHQARNHCWDVTMGSEEDVCVCCRNFWSRWWQYLLRMPLRLIHEWGKPSTPSLLSVVQLVDAWSRDFHKYCPIHLFSSVIRAIIANFCRDREWLAFIVSRSTLEGYVLSVDGDDILWLVNKPIIEDTGYDFHVVAVQSFLFLAVLS